MVRFRILIFPVFLVLTTLAFGNGLIENPPSRSWYCGYTTKPDHLVNKIAKYPVCSTAFAAIPDAGYRFMSVLTRSEGRAKVTPLPTHVCSFDSENWKGAQTPWDVPMDWPTSPMSPGLQSITWNGEYGAHYDDTRDFSYWITKPGFVYSTSRELTWADFEDAPFCNEIYDDKNPAANPNIVPDKTNLKYLTKCQVPARTGRHVIYGEWGRRESTYQRLHGCIDVAFGTTPIHRGGSLGKSVPGADAPAKRVDALGRRAPAGGGAARQGAKKLVKAP